MRAAPPDLRPPVGWPLLPLPDTSGALRWPSLAESVAGQLRKIIATAPGELMAHAGYGAGLGRFLHEPLSLALRARLRESIEQAVQRHEPRVLLEAVEVSDVSDEQAELGRLRVELRYRLRRDGQSGRLSAELSLGA